jgi:serine/threonine-protein kinase
MLTGTTPREFPPGRDPWHVILTTRPTPIRRHRPDLPERLATVLDTALSDQPEIGYSTAAALRQDLQ